MLKGMIMQFFFKRFFRSLLLASTAVLTLGVAVAQAQDDDPPLEAARLSFVHGAISIQQAGR